MACLKLWMLILILVTQQVQTTLQCPIQCHCATVENKLEIECWRAGLLQVPRNISTKVQMLDLSDNGISTLPDFLGDWRQLAVLSLAGNNITTIPSTTFKGLPTLKELDLSRNLIEDLTSIHADTLLEANSVLEFLNLSNNYFKKLDTQFGITFIKSYSIQHLDVSRCRIDRIDENNMLVLGHMMSLQVLNLSYNPLKWVTGLKSKTLKSLDVSNCELDFLDPNALKNLPALTQLNLSKNKALALNPGYLTSDSLTHIDVSYCSLTLLSVSGLPRLVQANFGNNKISSLTDLTFLNNHYLQEIDLSNNEIKEIHPDAFIGTKYLENINLAKNFIHQPLPPNIFSESIYLNKLNLSHNELNSFEILKIKNLISLDLSSCKIFKIQQKSLSHLPQLVTLNLSKNLLEHIPNDLRSVTLRVLDLSYCRVTTINNDTFQNLPALRQLKLTGNRFTDPFRVHMFQNNTHLTKISLEDNPWRCDCKSKQFHKLWEYLTTEPAKVPYTEREFLKCQSPEPLLKTSWEIACQLEWYPDMSSFSLFNRYGMFVLVTLCTFVGLMATVMVVRRGIKSRRKRQAERDRRLERAERIQNRLVRLHRQSVENEERERVEVRHLENREQRAPSVISHPPPYEEAILLPRLIGSRQDLDTEEQSMQPSPRPSPGQARSLPQQDEHEETDEVRTNTTEPKQNTSSTPTIVIDLYRDL